jgi:hypothetical protein
MTYVVECGCGSIYTHQSIVEVRVGDYGYGSDPTGDPLADSADRQDTPGRLVRVDPNDVVETAKIERRDFIGRRDDTRITITCENCLNTQTIVFRQHKGLTVVEVESAEIKPY